MKKPDWLKRMESGVKGEARTYALLAEHFWVLERSVDINGADFIIQRTFLDKDINSSMDYPRLGFVQSKYVSEDTTRIKVNKAYVFDGDKPRKDFFLIIHTTKTPDEDYMPSEKEMYCLTGEDIDEFIYNGYLSVVNDKDKEVIEITIKQLINKCEMGPISERTIVNKINQTLEGADFYARISLDKYLNKEPDLFDIIKRYRETSAARYFLDVKEQAQVLIQKMTPLIFLLTELVNSDDPESWVSDTEDIENLIRNILEFSKKICENEEDIKELSNLLYELRDSLKFNKESETQEIDLEQHEQIVNQAIGHYNDAELLDKLDALIRKKKNKDKYIKEKLKEYELAINDAETPDAIILFNHVIEHLKKKLT